jgi:hypothetical protein
MVASRVTNGALALDGTSYDEELDLVRVTEWSILTIR